MTSNKLKLNAIAEVLGYKLQWGSQMGWPERNDGSDTLVWTEDKKTGKSINWKPETNDADSFRLSLMFGIQIDIDEKTQTISASYMSVLGNPDQLRSFVTTCYDTPDYMPVVRRLVISAAYEAAKGILYKRAQIKQHDTRTLRLVSG